MSAVKKVMKAKSKKTHRRAKSAKVAGRRRQVVFARTGDGGPGSPGDKTS